MRSHGSRWTAFVREFAHLTSQNCQPSLNNFMVELLSLCVIQLGLKNGEHFEDLG